jgi:outer membrane protein TolC
LFLFIFTASALHAQRILTVEEAVANALQKNYDIILSRNDSTIAAIDYSYKNAVFLPQLNANAGAFWNNNSQKQTLADGSHRTKAG